MWPDDDYLIQIGRAVYAVTYMESMVINDLQRIDGLSPGLADELSERTTGQIARRLEHEAEALPAGKGQDFLRLASAHLKAMAAKRNSLMHARPITADDSGTQRLHRGIRGLTRQPEWFTVESAWLENFLADWEARLSELSAARV